MTKKRPPIVVMLSGDGKSYGDTGKPCDVYADYLAETQWGGREEGKDEGVWEGPPIGREGAAAGVKEGSIDMEELEDALRHTAKNKAAGTDGIPAEAWMNLGRGKAAMLEFLNMCWSREEFPGEWAEALVVGIFKRGTQWTRQTTGPYPDCRRRTNCLGTTDGKAAGRSRG